MMTYMLVTLSVMLVVIISAVFLHRRHCKTVSYEFQDYDFIDIPYVKIDIQGHTLNMAIDSGCGVSLIHRVALEKFDIGYTKSDRTTSLSALTDEVLEVDNIRIEYILGGHNVKDEFSVYEGKEFGNFKHKYNIELHGLLGTDFFDNHKCKIDFKNHCLIIS